MSSPMTTSVSVYPESFETATVFIPQLLNRLPEMIAELEGG